MRFSLIQEAVTKGRQKAEQLSESPVYASGKKHRAGKVTRWSGTVYHGSRDWNMAAEVSRGVLASYGAHEYEQLGIRYLSTSTDARIAYDHSIGGAVLRIECKHILVETASPGYEETDKFEDVDGIMIPVDEFGEHEITLLPAAFESARARVTAVQIQTGGKKIWFPYTLEEGPDGITRQWLQHVFGLRMAQVLDGFVVPWEGRLDAQRYSEDGDMIFVPDADSPLADGRKLVVSIDGRWFAWEGDGQSFWGTMPETAVEEEHRYTTASRFLKDHPVAPFKPSSAGSKLPKIPMRVRRKVD